MTHELAGVEGSLSLEVAARLRATMAAQQKTVTMMSAALGLDRKATKLRYDGKKSMNLDEVEALAAWLEVDPEALTSARVLAVAS